MYRSPEDKGTGVITRRGFAGLLGGGLVNQAANRPDIVFVIADDLSWHDCEPYGSRQVRTPNLARLAREGLCFDNMFSPTAMCAPTRQAICTGLYPVRNGAYPNHSFIYDGIRTLPKYFGGLGYRVGISGKEHFGPAELFPFERLGTRGEDPEPGQYERIAEFFRRDAHQPFFLVFASNQPHVPWNKGDPSAYPPDKLTIPPYLVDCPATRQALSKYFAEVTYFDTQVGAVLALLDDAGRKEDTLVMVASEQGAQFPFAKWTCYDAGLKAAFFARWPGKVKPGTRTAALTEYVDILPTILEAAGANPRFQKTGRPDAKGFPGFDGKSFLPLMLGRTNLHKQRVFGVQTTRGIIQGSPSYPIRSVRTSQYKYIRNLEPAAEFRDVLTGDKKGYFEAWREWAASHPESAERVRAYQHRPAVELYDINKDPYELHNLAPESRYASVCASLDRELTAWMRQQGDKGIATEMKAKERQMAGPEG